MPDQNPTEEALNKIEVGIRQLKVQYDMYFSGAMPRQPFETRKELEIQIKALGDTRMQRFADRYRYNSLAAKYQSMTELWSKMIRAKEEGRLRPGIPGFVEPVRRIAEQVGAVAAAESGASGGGAGVAGNGSPGAEAAGRFIFSDPSAEDSSARLFYDRYNEARGKKGKGRVSYERFVEQIARKTQSIRERSRCERVAYTIEINEGGVSLKAIPVRNGGKR